MSEMRDKLRALTLGAPAIRSKALVKWNGEDYEIRRPSLRQQREIDELSVVGKGKHAKKDSLRALALVLINCVIVPGTEEKVFEPADIAAMEDRGAEDFVGVFAEKLGELAKGANAEDIEKNSEGGQTDER